MPHHPSSSVSTTTSAVPAIQFPYPSALFDCRGRSLDLTLTRGLRLKDWEEETYRVSRIPSVLLGSNEKVKDDENVHMKDRTYEREIGLSYQQTQRIQLISSRLRASYADPPPRYSSGQILYFSTLRIPRFPAPLPPHQPYSRPPPNFWELVEKHGGLPDNEVQAKEWMEEEEKRERERRRARTALGGKRKRVVGGEEVVGDSEGSVVGSESGNGKAKIRRKENAKRGRLSHEVEAADPPPTVKQPLQLHPPHASTTTTVHAPPKKRQPRPQPQQERIEFVSQKGSSTSTVGELEDKGKGKGKSMVRENEGDDLGGRSRYFVRQGREAEPEKKDKETYLDEEEKEHEEDMDSLPVSRNQVADDGDPFMGFAGSGSDKGLGVNLGAIEHAADLSFNPSQQAGIHISTPKHLQIPAFSQDETLSARSRTPSAQVPPVTLSPVATAGPSRGTKRKLLAEIGRMESEDSEDKDLDFEGERDRRKVFARRGGSTGSQARAGGNGRDKNAREVYENDEDEDAAKEEEREKGDGAGDYSGSQHLLAKFTSGLGARLGRTESNNIATGGGLHATTDQHAHAISSPAGRSIHSQLSSTQRGSSPLAPSSVMGIGGTQALEARMEGVGMRAVGWLGGSRSGGV